MDLSVTYPERNPDYFAIYKDKIKNFSKIGV